MEKLFVYGTLRESSTQKKVIGRICTTKKDILEGYTVKKVVIEKKYYRAITKKKSTKVKGLVIAVTKKELLIIDKYETGKYYRKKVILKSGIHAWVYTKR